MERDDAVRRYIALCMPHPRIERNPGAVAQTQPIRVRGGSRKFSAQLARKQIYLIGSDTLANASLAAAAFANELTSSGAFTSVQWEVDAAVSQRPAVYLPHRAFLLSSRDQAALAAGDPAPLVKRALRAAYPPPAHATVERRNTWVHERFMRTTPRSGQCAPRRFLLASSGRRN